MRHQDKLPEDPSQYLVDFFGQYKDPQWDDMETCQQEIDQMQGNIPILEERIVQLERDIIVQKRKTWAGQLYSQCDPDGNVSYLFSSN
jgi:hypothetical protein